MNKTFAVALVSIALSSSFSSGALGAKYEVDAAHSNVSFTIRHLVSKVSGNFSDFGGSFEFDEKKPDATKGEFTVKAASINTNNAKRDGHLRTPDFFSVEKYPEIKLKTRKVTMNGKTGKLESEFTMLGVTKPVTFDIEYLGSGKSPSGGEVAGFTGTGKISRKDFGMTWNKALDAGNFVLGDDVTIQLQIEAAKK